MFGLAVMRPFGRVSVGRRGRAGSSRRGPSGVGRGRGRPSGPRCGRGRRPWTENHEAFRHSRRSRPPDASMTALWPGFPGREKSSSTRLRQAQRQAHWPSRRPANSGPLSTRMLARPAAQAAQPVELVHHRACPEVRPRRRRERLSRAAVHEGQGEPWSAIGPRSMASEGALVEGPVRHEVRREGVVRAADLGAGRPMPARPPASGRPCADRQALLAVEAADALVVGPPALAPRAGTWSRGWP